eukprot:gene8233-12708_t
MARHCLHPFSDSVVSFLREDDWIRVCAVSSDFAEAVAKGRVLSRWPYGGQAVIRSVGARQALRLLLLEANAVDARLYLVACAQERPPAGSVVRAAQTLSICDGWTAFKTHFIQRVSGGGSCPLLPDFPDLTPGPVLSRAACAIAEMLILESVDVTDNMVTCTFYLSVLSTSASLNDPTSELSRIETCFSSNCPVDITLYENNVPRNIYPAEEYQTEAMPDHAALEHLSAHLPLEQPVSADFLWAVLASLLSFPKPALLEYSLPTLLVGDA